MADPKGVHGVVGWHTHPPLPDAPGDHLTPLSPSSEHTPGFHSFPRLEASDLLRAPRPDTGGVKQILFVLPSIMDFVDNILLIPLLLSGDKQPDLDITERKYVNVDHHR